MHCNVYPIFVKFVRLTHSNKELLTYLQKCWVFFCSYFATLVTPVRRINRSVSYALFHFTVVD